MSWIADVAVGVGVVVAIVGSLMYLAKKGFFEPETNAETQAEREEQTGAAKSEDFSIPFRSRVGAWSAPYKVFVVSLVALGVAVAVMVYQIAKTGAPYQEYLTREVRYGLVAVVGVAGGVRLRSWFDSQVAKLTVIYNRTGERDLVERIPYAKTAVSRTNGEVTLPEVADSSLFGLFWRYKQVGEDRRLRGGDKPLSDVVTHRVPPHADELPDGAGWVVETHDDGDKILSGATSTADVTYRSPNSLSSERAIQLREKRKRLNAQLKNVKATNAELTKELERLRKKIENDEYQDREALKSDFQDFSEMFRSFSVEIDDGSENGDGSDLDESDGQNGRGVKA
jgi:hypothetical protein